ncbi:Na(+)/H(+) antiporter NhaA [anaerobic digester metagenome]
MISGSCKNFLRWMSVAGLLSVLAFALAMIVSNTGLASWYAGIRSPMLGVSYGEMTLGRPVLVWINLALMSMVLFVVALECKRGVTEEELAGPDRLRLPALGALGGMIAAGAVHALLSRAQGDSGLLWAASMGTDAALGLAVLSILGERVPAALKSLFATTAMFSLLGSSVVLAGVQGGLPSWPVLTAAGVCAAVFVCMRFAAVELVSPYLLTGAVLWVVAAGEGSLALLAGPLTALFVPGRSRDASAFPLLGLEQDLLPTVCCVALPILVFASAGFSPVEAPADSSTWREALPAFLGMLPAKAAGIFGMCWMGTKLRLCALPAGIGWKEFGGVALLVGAGFTVNVFLGLGLAGHDGPAVNDIRLAAMAASALSASCGYAILRYALARRRNKVIQRT